MLKRFRAAALLVAVLALVFPALGQFGGGGGGGAGGGAGGAGIPLGGGGHKSSEDERPVEKKNPNERPVHGVVTDADGQAIAGAVVELKDTKTQKVLSALTHDKGDYTFSGLKKSDDYELKATVHEHSSEPHTLSSYDTREQPVVNLQIK
jgi:hypothetical protein